MPTATPFNFYGTIDTSDTSKVAGGTAFPFCVENVDVSGFDYWTTLGGFNKDSVGSPTQTQIGLSWQNACKLFWNLYQINGTETATPLSPSPNAVNDLTDGVAEPQDRQCEDDSENFGANIQYDELAQPTNLSSNFYGTYGNIVRMYNGATSNESNFVGYGIKSDIATAFAGLDYNPVGIYMVYIGPPNFVVYVCSYGDEVGNSTEDYAYTTLQNIPVLCAAYDDSTATVDAANLSAGGTITIDSIEFYTYT